MEIITPNTQINYARLQTTQKIFASGIKPKPIYHYTSIGGLQGILQNQTLHFTNIKYMNDKDEITAGLESIAQACEFSETARDGLLSSLIDCGTQTFVCCFSLESDSLPMWNYYTKEIHNQGYNIEFDSRKLVESILRSNPCLDGCDFAFGSVDYSKNNYSECGITIRNKITATIDLVFAKVLLAASKAAQTAHSNIDQTNITAWEETINNLEKKTTDLPFTYLFLQRRKLQI